jgi:NitT/TauT family transport system ATP-binding protein
VQLAIVFARQTIASRSRAIGAEPALRAERLNIRYWQERRGAFFQAVENLDLDVPASQFVSILGPSGCGKTTFLNAVDGLISISSGSLTLNGRPIVKPGRDRAMVFQQPLLLPWRTVLRNVTYGLELDSVPKAQAVERATRCIELVGLKDFANAYPGELSGGMQQRVNLARAMVTDPDILLMDEPFASVDALTREFMQLELLKLWEASRKTVVFITHDITEAVFLSDRVVVFTARPARVKLSLPIDLPRPRPAEIKRDPRFVEYEGIVWESIRDEMKGSWA